MTKSEIEKFYQGVCTKTNNAPDPGEFRGWLKTLEMFTVDDLREAIDAWWTGSRFMPTAKELLPEAIASRNRRAARSTATQYLVAWRCPECGFGCCGFISPDDHRTRYCQRCRASMTEVLREAAIPQHNRRAA
jgi:hypothetical protein